VVKKFEVPVPKPYPVHVVYYKHINEDDPAPTKPKNSFKAKTNHYNNFEYGGNLEYSPSENHEYLYSGY
jgi:hypothetical protein